MEVLEDLMRRIEPHFSEEVMGRLEKKTWGKSFQKIEQPAIKKPLPLLEAQDPLIDSNLGTIDFPRLTKISGLLNEKGRARLLALITQYKDFFEWD